MSGANLKSLIVDDHMLVRNMIKQHCEKKGLEDFAFATNGQEALQMIENDNFDVVFADWNMPVLTGMDLLKTLRSKKEYDSLAFVMVTAETDKSKVIEVMQAGATSYISKPFSEQEFSKNLDQVMAWVEKNN